MFRHFLYKIALFISKRLSLKASYQIAILLSDLQYYFSWKDRKAVRNNLKQILDSHDNLSFHSKEVFRNFGRYLVEFLRMDEMVDKDFIKDKVKVNNLYYLKEVLKKGKGGIITTAHIGNWEMGAATLCLLGYPVAAIALPHKEYAVNEIFNNQRRSKGIQVVPTRIAIRRCTETLKNNKLIAVVGERDFGAKGEVLDFLGKKVLIPNGPAMFSMKTGAPIIPTFLTRKDDGLFEFIIEKPIYPTESNNEEDGKMNKIILMKEYIKVIEKFIKKYPSQWLMFREYGI